MSQVKNLRAMFEQKGDSSPPDRGRVQQGLPSTPADSPRPLSRVRTSFVTVEKDGRVGLQRDTSSDSIPTLSRTLSTGTESDIAVPAAPLSPARSRSPVKLEDSKPAPIVQTPKRIPAPIPEEATPVTPTKAALPVSPAKPAREATPKPPPPAEVKISAPTPVRTDKDQNDKSPSKSLDTKAAQRDKSPTPSPRKLFAKLPSNTNNEPASSTPKKTLEAPASAPNGLKKALDTPKNVPSSQPAPPAVARSNGVAIGATKDTSSSASAKPSRTTAPTSSIPLRPKIASTAPNSKEAHKPIAASAGKSAPKAISTVRANTKPSAKSPGLAVKTPTVKTPTSPAKPATTKATTTSKPPSKTTDRKIHAATDKSSSASITATAPKLTAGKSSSSTAAKKPPAVQTFPSNGIGFVKPKVKSPTRPVQLPSSLTTHTASSATKANVPRQSLSRQSGNFLTLHHPSSSSAVRSPSRTSVSTVGTATGTGTAPKTLRRQSSTVSRPRPSIGPPPKQTARDHPVTKKEKEVDEGFLARMMRPTQASALKTADKAQLSPPRKQPVTVAVAVVEATVTKATRKSVTPRESLVAPAKKAVPKALLPVERPPACITRNPNVAAPPAEEKALVADVIVEATKEAEPASNVATPAGEAEPAKEAPVEETVNEVAEEEAAEEEPAEAAVIEAEPIEEEVIGEEPVEEAADEEDVPVVIETPAEDEEEDKEESLVESVEETASEPTAEATAEDVDEKSFTEEETSPVDAAEASEEEAEAAVEDSDTSAVEASVADSDIPEAGTEH